MESESIILLLLLQLSAAASRLRPKQLRTLLHPNLFKASLFTPSQEVPISYKSFCTILYYCFTLKIQFFKFLP
jgi:hypothetical protein